MRWRAGRRSGNIEDRRAMRMPGGRTGLGLAGVAVMAVLMYLSGQSPTEILRVVFETGQLEAGDTFALPYDQL